MKDNKVPDLPKTDIILNDNKLSVLIDSGALANCISKISYEKLMPHPQLSPTTIKIYPFPPNVCLLVSAFKCNVEQGQKVEQCTFYVIKGGCFNIRIYRTSKALGLIKIVTTVSSIPQYSTVADELVATHPELFQAIRKLKDYQVKLHINPDVKPTCQPHRRVPFHLCQKVEDELHKLEADDINEEVTGPMPWVFSVAAPKPRDPDRVRLCVVM